MAAGPCLNPNCKSHGKPHPNCHCYDGIGEHMAEGGEITEYCAKGMPHKPGCEYYADGGDVPKYEDSQPVQAAADVPKYEDSQPIASDAPKYEDSTPVEPPKYEDSVPLSHKFDSNTVLGNVNAAAEGAYNGATSNLGPHIPGMGAPGEAEAANSLAYHAGEVAGIIANPVRLIKMAGPVVSGALQAGAFATGDELHDYLSGNKHLSNLDDDKVAAMHIVGAGGIGALLGKGEKFAGDVAAKFAPKFEQLAQGIGASKIDLTPEQLEQLSPLAKRAYTAFKKILPASENKIASTVLATPLAAAGAGAGYYAGDKIDQAMGNEHNQVARSLAGFLGTAGEAKGYQILKPLIEKSVTPFIDSSIKKVLTPVVLKALSVGASSGIKEGINYSAAASKGRGVVNKAIDSLFGGGQPLKAAGLSEATNPKNIKALEDYIDNGGINPQVQATVQQDADGQEPANYAEGGHVEAAPEQDPTKPKSLNSNLQHVYPEQHLLNVQNKAKVSNYLQQLKPQKKVGGPLFDVQHPDPIAERSYKRAIHAAIDPTRILEHAKKGTLVPDHVKHMNNMYPGVMDLYRHEITKKLMKLQLEGKRPPIKLRQNLSMIMGTDLDSTTTPQSIMAAQATFAPKQTPGQQDQKPPAKSTAKLDKVSKNDTTATQAGMARRQGEKS